MLVTLPSKFALVAPTEVAARGIDGGGEGGDIEGEEDGIVAVGVGVAQLVIKLSESVASPSSLL